MSKGTKTDWSLIGGLLVASVASNGALAETPQAATKPGPTPALTALSVTPNGQNYVAGSQMGVTGGAFGKSPAWSVNTALSHVNAFAFSPDGSVLAIAGGSPAVAGTIELWRWPDRVQLGRLEGHQDLVNAVTWLPPRGKILATAATDRTLRVWDADSQQCLATLEGHSAPVLALAASPDGQWLCSGSVDQTIRVWETRNWQLQRTLNNHLGTVHGVAFQPGVVEGKPMCLASASEDGTVRIWYPKIGRLVRIVRHRVPVYCLAWTKDGSQLYTGSADGCVRMLGGERHAITQTRLLCDGWIVSLAVGDADDRVLAGTTLGDVVVATVNDADQPPGNRTDAKN